MKRPCVEDLETAADWLSYNEGGEGEAEACSRVATWLRAYARESEERLTARRAGCSVGYLRKILADEKSKRAPDQPTTGDS